MKRIKLASAISLILVGTTSQVSAQETNENSQQAKEKPSFEVIEVTAQKRRQSVQEVPIAIQAFNEESISKLGAALVTDLSRAAPSLNFGGVNGSLMKMGIRGIVDFSRNIGIDARTGIYIDGVYQGRSYSANQPVIGLSSVEILRGPQGTLFGKNTVSGAINLSTKAASEDFEAILGLEAGNDGLLRYSAYINGAITDKLYGSFSFADSSSDGYYDNLTTGDTWGDVENDVARLELRYKATDSLEFILRADKGSSYNTLPAYTSASLEPFTTIKGTLDQDILDFSGESLTVNYDFDSGYQFTSITAHRKTESENYNDNDMTPAVFLHDDPYGEISKQFTQEFRVVSPRFDNYDWVTGLYYYDGTTDSTNRSITIGADFTNAFLAPAFAAIPPIYDLIVANANGLAGTVKAPSELENQSTAAYIHGNYRINDMYEITAGLRYTKEEKDLTFSQQNYPNDPAVAAMLEAAVGGLFPFSMSPGAALGAINYAPFERSKSETDLSPTLGLNIKLSEDQLLYGKYTKGFKSGGWNAETRLTGLASFEFKDESVTNFELGYKSILFDDNVRFNVALFSSQFDDFQIFQFIPTGPNTSANELTNAGEVSNQGIEIETQWYATENLLLTFNGTFLDSVYDKYENEVKDPLTGELVIVDYAGNNLEFAPDTKLYFDASYTMAFESGDLVLSVDYSYTSESYGDASNEADYTMPSYSLVNTRATFFASSGDWQASLWVKNLADEEYSTNSNRSFLRAPRLLWGPHRTFGASVQFMF